MLGGLGHSGLGPGCWCCSSAARPLGPWVAAGLLRGQLAAAGTSDRLLQGRLLAGIVRTALPCGSCGGSGFGWLQQPCIGLRFSWRCFTRQLGVRRSRLLAAGGWVLIGVLANARVLLIEKLFARVVLPGQHQRSRCSVVGPWTRCRGSGLEYATGKPYYSVTLFCLTTHVTQLELELARWWSEADASCCPAALQQPWVGVKCRLQSAWGWLVLAAIHSVPAACMHSTAGSAWCSCPFIAARKHSHHW